MATIDISLNHPLSDGESIEFKATCDSSSATGLKITYPTDDEGVLSSKTLTFKDAHGNSLNSKANIFLAGSYIKVIADATTSTAYIQNADTNGYLEGKFTEKLSVLYTANVPADGWTQNSGYAQQIITMSGLLTTDTFLVDVNMPQTANVSTQQEYLDAWATIGKAQCITNGQLRLTVFGTAPNASFPIKVLAVRK